MIYDLIDKKKMQTIILENGLEIIWYENKEFKSYYFNYLVNYGSNDFTYLKDNKEVTHFPGTAHFLEHVMFNTKHGDAFNLFSENLASANAYTTYKHTSYLFETKENSEKNLKILLKMTNNFEITKEQVEKEKGIILSEIDMYDKDIDYEIYQKNLENALKNSKYRNEILGNKEDIKKMNIENLKEAFEDFYKPNNCKLIMVGPEIKQLVNTAKSFFENEKFKIHENEKQIEKINISEELIKDEEKTNKKIYYKKWISQQYNCITYKYIFENKFTKKEKQSYELYINILLENDWSMINEQYNELIDKNVLDEQFYTDCLVDSNFILIKYYFNSKEEKKEIIENLIFDKLVENSKINQITLNAFLNKKIGILIKKMNRPENVGELLVRNSLEQINLEKKYENIKKTQITDIQKLQEKLKKSKKEKIETLITNKML